MVKKLFNQFAGNKIILPWHRDRLKEKHKEIAKKERELPPVDEQTEELFQLIIEKSLKEGIEIELTLLEEKYLSKIRGIIQKADPSSGKIHLLTENGLIKIYRNQIREIKE